MICRKRTFSIAMAAYDRAALPLEACRFRSAVIPLDETPVGKQA